MLALRHIALHITPDCTGFTKDEIAVLIKLKKSIRHICNDCVDKPKISTERETSVTIDDKLEATDKKVEKY